MKKILIFLCFSALLSMVFGNSDSICSLPKKVGPCKAAFPKWYFNSELSKCEQFIYGGCQANGNNFNSYQECSAACEPKVILGDSACQLLPDSGPCRMYLERFYFNAQTGQCQKFVYGGCQGNSNNFQDESSCLQACSVKSNDCSSAPETGLCRAYFLKYYYDAESKQCKKFVYGGCGGNSNKYDDEQSCLNACNPQ